jgi:chorismate-pyruvate lyase
MITTYPISIEKLIDLEDSTTFFLEHIKGQPVKVFVESQNEIIEENTLVLRRIARLYFESFNNPVVVASSSLQKEKLTPKEYKLLTKKEMPIGRIFKLLNMQKPIVKKNISNSIVNSLEMASILNVMSMDVIEKKYDYWVGDRHMGTIHEFFNWESLSRCISGKI